MALIDSLRKRVALHLYIWRYRLATVPMIFKLKPMAGADDGEDPPKDPPEGDPADPAEGEDPPKEDSPPVDWKAMARKHEREAKKHRKQADEIARQLKDREDSDKTEQEKAIEKAREEARAEALTEAQKGQRHDRLDIAATKAAVKGVRLNDDDEAVKFADPDDALIYVERGIASGDIDEDEIFDSEGAVQTDALQKALADILERKPHLRDGGGEATPRRVNGDGDGGKGSGAGRSLGDMSVDDHLKAIQKSR